VLALMVVLAVVEWVPVLVVMVVVRLSSTA
jgi:hypothetical protein